MEFIAFIFFIVAFTYSTVGHGGASTYLALLALSNYSPALCKSSALLLNVAVASIAFVNFYKVVQFPWRTFLGLIIASIPASFIGSKVELDPEIYKLILGIILIISALRLFEFPWLGSVSAAPIPNKFPLALQIISGLFIGYLSGMIGIGGGIILSPLLLIMRWHSPKETAALSAGFIVVNSIAGLLGNAQFPNSWNHELSWILLASIIGGVFGSWKGASDFSNTTLKRILAIVLIIASLKLIGGDNLSTLFLFLH